MNRAIEIIRIKKITINNYLHDAMRYAECPARRASKSTYFTSFAYSWLISENFRSGCLLNAPPS